MAVFPPEPVMNIASLNRLYATYSTASATPVKAAATDGSSAAT